MIARFIPSGKRPRSRSCSAPTARRISNSRCAGNHATRRKELPRGAGEEDKKRFANARSYMVRLDDLAVCYKCRKRFELTGQSTVLIPDNLGDPNADPENFGNR